MKYCLLYLLVLWSAPLFSQRPATAAETNEDARVLQELSAAMPHTIEGAMESERSFGSSKLDGITGFHSDMNFVTRDVFTHQYTITYEFTKALPGLEQKVADAKAKNDFTYLVGVSACEIEIWVNTAPQNPSYYHTPLKQVNAIPGAAQVWQDAEGAETVFAFFGNNWQVKSKKETGEDNNGKPEQQYSLTASLRSHPGTDIQGIMLHVKGHSDLSGIILKQVNWKKIADLLGTGRYSEDESEEALKKYFPEKPVKPVPGNNFLSFTYTGEDGVPHEMKISSAAHNLSNAAILINHNENPKHLTEAHIDFRIQDDRDPNRLFSLSLPIIRTTGTVTATFQSDDDYEIMWRGNTDVNHSFNPGNIEIKLTRWAPVGDFLEGTFSGTAILKDHNDFSTVKPVYTITNGKFRIRRIADQIK